ncbi:MAG: hypothetical protein A2W35_20990 [Chloroflexi bacterium RBG_16_57_11]|nr:MAG: hypothetical protein A2W35_20990 [Chloroflexi bacterium RBG_16_57_11]
MNISNLSNQIEIAFWTGVVSLLRHRRNTRPVSLALLILLVLFTLLLTAFTFVSSGRTTRLHEPKSAAVHLAHYSARPDNGQNNLLLILVDQVDATEPGLQGVWMLIHDSSGRKITFMPIYPAESKFGQDVRQAVGMEKVSGLSPKLEQVLQKQGLWWDNYLVIDKEILSRLVQQADGIDLGNGRLDGQQVIGLLPIAGQDAQTAIGLQARIARGICQRFDSVLKDEGPQPVSELLIGEAMNQPVNSSLSHADLLASWNRLMRTGGLACEFPTLIGR